MSPVLKAEDWLCCRLADFLARMIAWGARLLGRRREGGKRNVFVYANDLFGDTIVKLPLFFALRREFPAEKFHLTLVLSPACAGMVSRLNCCDEIIEEGLLHERHSLFWIVSKNGFLAKSLRWAAVHKADVFMACHRTRSLGSDFALRLCRPCLAAAYAVDLENPMLPMSARYQVAKFDRFYSFLLDQCRGRHQIKDMSMILSAAAGREMRLARPAAAEIRPMLDFTVAERLPESYIALVPGARVAYRRWPAERFAEVAKRLGGNIVVVGSREEAGLAKEIRERSGRDIVDLCGKTSLAQLGGVLMKAKLVIANETGTTNFAAVVGARTVCILGGGDFGAFFPNECCPNAVCVCRRRECFNCGWRCTEKGFSEEKTAPCVEAVTVEDVAASAAAALQGHVDRAD